ncbi:hypothetical protein GCM10009777_39670 [Microbacterium pumilum]|uniref:Peptide ABC transporter permease n=2 Tax=Microbacterium pumilum TaxID=344165 RepID=A0ABP5EL48_9MICO
MVEPGSYVARRAGRELGSVVETGNGNYVALDCDVEGIGTYETLSAAKQSVDDQYRWHSKGHIPHRYRRGIVVASVAGLLPVSLLLVALWVSASP